MRVLITGCSRHSKDLIDVLRSNYDNEPVYVVGINCNPDVLLRKGVDACYVVPRSDSDEYIGVLLAICKKENIDVILPYITFELEIMARNKYFFENEGIKVSVSSLESLKLVNDKVQLAKMYPYLMPKQTVAKKIEDVMEFANSIGYPRKKFCCKLPNRCGGVGFAVIDEEKGRDITLFNKFGVNRYITLAMLNELLMSYNDSIILQEYEEGHDYSMCILADKGKVLYGTGFEATVMSYGSAMNAKVTFNQKAYDIAKMITADSGLDGNACFDFILKEDGEPILLEVNPRLSATLPFLAKAGLNLPYLRCKQILGHDVSDQKFDINYELRMQKNYETEIF